MIHPLAWCLFLNYSKSIARYIVKRGISLIWQIDDIKQIDLPHFTLSGLNSQSPCAEHAPTMSPERHCSPHAFPPQPCSEQGFSSALTQNPSPSQTPSPKLGLLQAKPHSIPLHVRTYKVGTKMERKTTSIQYKPFQ